ncbi:MAG TPA: hypothetical protein VHQ86_03735 [Candidatus Saccharimonadia bacterium]|nr:hypothetical protein [Candidatus Saccharimonadia bacterium]
MDPNQLPPSLNRPQMQPQPQFVGRPPSGMPTGYQQPQQGSRKILPIVIIVLVLVLGVGGFAYYNYMRTPDQVFRSAFSNALSLKSFTQTGDQSGAHVEIKYDVENTHDPRVSATVKVSADGKEVANIEGYGTFSNTYVKYTDIAGVSSGLLNKWVQLRRNGTLPSYIQPATTFFPIFDPQYSLLGQAIFANVPRADRNALVDYIVKNQVYKYDAQKVVKTKVEGADVFKYDVSLQHMDTLNEKAAKILGITDPDALKLIARSDVELTNATLYISINSPKLVKVTTSDATIEYSAFNNTKLPDEPHADLQYQQFLAQTKSGL